MKSYIGLMNEAAAKEMNIVYKPTEFAGIVKYIYFAYEPGDETDTYPDYDWDEATETTFAATKIMTMGDVLGISVGPTIYVVTNESGFRGASAILDTDSLRRQLPKGKYVMLPSSIHEVLLYPDDGNVMSNFVEMVTSINASQVAPEEQLVDAAYTITID